MKEDASGTALKAPQRALWVETVDNTLNDSLKAGVG
jgi:hypothetical protein